MRGLRNISIAATLLLSAPAFAQKLPTALGEEVPAGNAVSGVPCRLRAIDPTSGGSERWRVLCEGWERASIGIWRSGGSGKLEAYIADDGAFRRTLELAYLCEPAQPRRVLGDLEAQVRSCKLRDGGWPAFLMVARVGGKTVGVEGLPDALPAAETALALMAGRAPPAAAGGQALQDYNIKLLQETLGTGFKNVGLQDMSAARGLEQLTRELNNMRDFDAAIETNQRWLELVERVNGRDSPNNAHAMSYMTLNFGRANRWQESAEMEKRAAPLLERAPDRNWLPQHMSFLAGLALQRGDNVRAKRLAEEAITYRREKLGQRGGRWFALAYYRAGQVYRATGDVADAERALREALSAYQGIYGNVHYWVAASRQELGGALAQAGRNAEAEAELREAVRQLELVHGDRRTSVGALVELGQFLTRTGRADEALQTYRKAAGFAAKNRRDRPQMRQSTLSPYYFALVPAGQPVGGAQAAELFSAMQIPVDPVVGQAVTLMSARVADSDPAVSALARQLQDATAELVRLRARLGRAEGQDDEARDASAENALAAQVREAAEKLDRLEAQLQAAQPRYARLTNPPPMSVADATKLLKPGEALAMTLTTERWTYVVVVRDGQATAQAVPLGQRDFERTVDELRRGIDWLRLGPQDFDLVAAHALYAKLLGPLDSRLAGVTHLIIVPGGPLASMPLSFLVRKPPTQGDYAGAAWLARDMAVSVLPAVSSLAEIRSVAKPSAAKLPFIGFGNPGFGGAAGAGDASLAALGRKCRVTADERADPALLQALAPLPETADEIRAMAAALKAPADSVVLGAAASEAEIRKRNLTQYRVLAFATHGLLPGELACQNEPALALTPGRGNTAADDGLLNASEIARLRLDADWVVLSACNTAGPDGSARGGQALSGLVRAFLYAGSRAVLATHWAVASEPTVTLTTGTFTAFAKPGTGRAEALRQSQLAMLQDPKTQHPVFWAPFVVVGEGAR